MAPQTDEVDLIELRRLMLEALEKMEAEHPRVTAEVLQTYLEMTTGKKYSLSQLGNNLRILKKKRIVEDVRSRGHRYWALTGKKYSEDEVVRVLVAFPKRMHDQIVEFSKFASLSKTQFVVNMVGVGLRSLSPLKREMDFPAVPEVPESAQVPNTE